MTQFLPPNLLALFAARDPIPYLPPVERLSHEKRTTGYTGVSDYVQYFESGPPPPRPKYENKEERAERRRREKQEQVTYKLEQEIAMWDPSSNKKGTLDPFKTVFVGRVNYDTTESKLKREFESYGTISKITLVKDKKTSKARGYAFVEYEHERDMHSAFKHADGKKVDGRRILVDVERGRSVKGWLPRRLGGGLGGTRRGGPDVNVKISGREDPDRERFRDEKRDDRRDRRDRERSKERSSVERLDRPRERRRSSDRVERNPNQIPKDRNDRSDRDRDRDTKDRKRRRSRSRDRNNPEEEEKDRSRKKSKSRSPREKKRRRSRSKDKKRDKKDRDRDRDRKDRDRGKIKPEKPPKEETEDGIPQIRIKEEPVDDYPSYDNYDNDYGNNHHVKTES